MVTGKDVIFALTNQGQANNDFLANELQASWQGELGTGVAAGITATAQTGAKWTYYEPFGDPYFADDNNLQFPPKTDDAANNTWRDGSTNQNLNRGIDIIGAGAGGAGIQVTPAYKVGASVVGQRVVRTRSNGLRSQVAFLSFGIEGINRRYHKDSTGAPWPQNVRPAFADGITKWMKTGSISGQVINDQTNLPIPNFLVEIDGWDGQTYFARTDSNGNYQVLGLTLETFQVNQGAGFIAETFSTYSIRPAVYAGGTQVNPGFANINPIGVGLFGPQPVTGENLRVIPSPTGGFTGIVKQSNGTFNDRTDDTPIANLPVLVRSIFPSPIFPNQGRYAQLTKTDAQGQFTFTGVPTNTDLQIVFNPRLDDPSTPNVDENDIPLESGLRNVYITTYGGPRPDVGRRVIPDAQRPVTDLPDASAPGGVRRLVLGVTSTALEAPINQVFFLNDGPADDTVIDDSTPAIHGTLWCRSVRQSMGWFDSTVLRSAEPH